MTLDIHDHEGSSLEAAYLYGQDATDSVETIHAAEYRRILEGE